jgi:phage/plasmid-associated DNA primase
MGDVGDDIARIEAFRGRLLTMTNALPKFGDTSGALAGRIVLLRMCQSFYGREDTTPTNELPTELPGILKVAMRGYARPLHHPRLHAGHAR